MKFELPKLPYALDALSPVISATTIEYHYGKHERAYIDNTNKLIEDTEYENMPLEEIVVKSDGKLFNQASQAWNHIFYFFQFSPDPFKEPSGRLREQIDAQFGSLDEFKKQFEDQGVAIFGSGWIWLAADKDGKLHIIPTQNAGNPIKDGLKPILVFDVWEHAYYLDYQNLRGSYLHRLWDILDWAIIEMRYEN